MKFSRSIAKAIAGLLLLATTVANARVLQLDRIVLTVTDLARSEAFYHQGLGFETVSESTIDDPAYAHLLGVDGARLHVATMRLGAETIELQQYEQAGKPYPSGSRSPDLWFQHFAVIVADMPKAYEHLRAHVKLEAISVGGPQTLPPQNGQVQAFKFRDPDGHPLELLHFPPGQGRPVWQAHGSGALFLGIDHSAIGVSDTARSTSFYSRLLGLEQAYTVINRGPTQEHLDGTFNAVVDITGLRPTAPAGPGVEFLDYLTPPTGRPAALDTASNDLVHVHLVMRVDNLDDMAAELLNAHVPFISPGVVGLDASRYGFGKALMLRDPDGHALLLAQEAASPPSSSFPLR